MYHPPTTDDIIRVFGKHTPKPILPLKKFAVLVLLTEKNGELHFILTKRAPNVRQPGDICFPGGHQEEGESFQETALRETEEELGIPAASIRILGKTDFMLTAYGGIIQPYIGFVSYKHYCVLTYQKEEVAEVFTVPMRALLTQEPEVYDMYWKADMSVPFPYDRIENGKAYGFRENRVPELFYTYENRTIWGLTAQIIAHIAQMLSQPPQPLEQKRKKH